MKYIFLICLAWSLNATARIDVATGNFSDSWVDGQIGPDFSGYQIRRIYNSKSNWDGVFGRGWCATFEVSLSFKKQVIMNTCDNREINFEPDGGKNSFSNMNFGQIFKDTNGYHWLNNGQLVNFSNEGRLTAIKNKTNSITFFYTNERLEKILEDTTGASASFLYSADKSRIEKIVGLKQPIEYSYTKDLLTSLKNSWGSKYTYAYDEASNLIRTDYPDKTYEQMSYEKKTGSILSFRSRQGCEEKLNYKSGTQVQLTCDGETSPVEKEETDFQVMNSSDNLLRLFWKDGQVVDLLYNRNPRRPSEAIVGLFETKKKISYLYNHRGNLSEIRDDDVVVKLNPDELGRAREMSIKNKKSKLNLVISYLGKSSKPQSIGVKGKPAITLNYHSDGNIKDIATSLSDTEQAKVWSSYTKVVDLIKPLMGDQ